MKTWREWAEDELSSDPLVPFSITATRKGDGFWWVQSGEYGCSARTLDEAINGLFQFMLGPRK